MDICYMGDTPCSNFFMKKSYCLFLVLLAIAGCNKDENDKKEVPILNISGFRLTDISGNTIGQYGNPDNDWTLQNFTNFFGEDRDVLLTANNTGAPNTNAASITVGSAVAYPNPCNQAFIFSTFATDSVKLTLMIENEYGARLLTHEQNFKGAVSITVDVSNRSLFSNKASLRIYYCYSTKNNPYYKAGYGDIKICNSANGTLGGSTDCF